MRSSVSSFVTRWRTKWSRPITASEPQAPLWQRAGDLWFPVLGLIYLIAFVSFGVQAQGLTGSNGILPLARFFEAAYGAYGAKAWWYFPSLLWVHPSDPLLHITWIAGAACAVVLALGFARRAMLLVLWVLWLSLCCAGQDFLSYQWDVLLLEAGFLSIFLDGTLPRIRLLRWLLFRLMFLSGAVKLLSGDQTWRNLTALEYHYYTQPLPTPVAWYMYQLPAAFQRASTAFVFVVELLVPFLIFGPRPLRRAAAAAIAGLQLLILLTGNYAFFNLLTIALCLPLVAEPPVRRINWRDIAIAGTYLFLSGLQMVQLFAGTVPAPSGALLEAVAPFRTVNTYGLFAVMTTTRPEIIVEGSNDGVSWRAYGFRYKPGDLRRAPPVVEPHQPRLDWQMWFAALGSYRDNPWFSQFLLRLLEGSPPVLRLLGSNPFPGAPPRYVRALLYEYRFTDFAERRATGDWWKREPKGVYFAGGSLGRAPNGR